MLRFVFILTIFIISCFHLNGKQQFIFINFRSINYSKVEADALSDYFSKKLQEKFDIELIRSSDLKGKIDNHLLLEALNNNQFIDISNKINVDSIILGSITQLSSIITINVKSINAVQNKVVFEETISLRSEKLLEETLDKISNKIGEYILADDRSVGKETEVKKARFQNNWKGYDFIDNYNNDELKSYYLGKRSLGHKFNTETFSVNKTIGKTKKVIIKSSDVTVEVKNLSIQFDDGSAFIYSDSFFVGAEQSNVITFSSELVKIDKIKFNVKANTSITNNAVIYLSISE